MLNPGNIAPLPVSAACGFVLFSVLEFLWAGMHFYSGEGVAAPWSLHDGLVVQEMLNRGVWPMRE
jgi:hypothetical protein